MRAILERLPVKERVTNQNINSFTTVNKLMGELVHTCCGVRKRRFASSNC
jgi:hypothetical protein